MPDVTIHIDVSCTRCGESLATETYYEGRTFTVEPCPKCVAAERREGYDEGLSDGEVE